MRGDSWVRDSSKLLREKMFKDGKCVVYDEFDEDAHPRDESGKFTSGGGESGGSGNESGGEKDRSGTSIGKTTYENFSKMSREDKFDTLSKAAKDMDTFCNDLSYEIDSSDDLYDYAWDMADEVGADYEGDSGGNWWPPTPPEYDLGTEDGRDSFYATCLTGKLAKTTLTEIMSEKDAKNCMDRLWDNYAK